jgi:CspA family cold shock protein
MATGTVKWFDPSKGFGFVLTDDGMEVFVHYTDIDREGFRCLRTGQVVEFTCVNTDHGLRGREVRVVDEDPAPQAD